MPIPPAMAVIPVIIMPAFIRFMFMVALVPVAVMVGVTGNDIVAGIVALADDGLPAVAFVPAVPAFIGIMMPVRHGLVDDNLVAAVQVITPEQGGPGSGSDPMAVHPVDVLPLGYIIIGFYVGQVIIFHIIVAGRAPQRLVDDVDLNLCAEGTACQATEDDACAKN